MHINMQFKSHLCQNYVFFSGKNKTKRDLK